MRSGNERKSSALDCDVGLGLNTASYTCDVGGGYGGGPLFSYTSNRVSDCAGSDVYHHHHQSPNNTLFSPRSFQNTPFRVPAGGGGGMSGKALFTESQWQELERQNMIQKYFLASLPVPHQLLLPSSSPSTPQCNMGSGLELRFGTSSGSSCPSSDPEPWRCKRTDGKKWRCSRDVAPELKYCERHATKAKSRSRKHVEIIAPVPPPPKLSPSFIMPSPPPTSSSSYDQSRSIEWFMRGGGSKQPQWQQQPTKIPSPDSNKTKLAYRDHYYEEEEVEVDKQQGGFYVPDTSNLHKHHKMDTTAATTQTTRHFFIDSWEKDVGFDVGLRAKKDKKLSPSSLSLSMSGSGGGGGGNNYNNSNNYYNNNSNNDEDDANNGGGGGVSWMNVISAAAAGAPGGPLGEALCLGNSATWSLASPARGGGYSAMSNNNSNNTTNSSGCSKSSCEDATHALNFIG